MDASTTRDRAMVQRLAEKLHSLQKQKTNVSASTGAGMNIEHIRAAREALEHEVAKLFAEFRGKTGLSVNRVSVKLLTEQRLCDQSPRVVGEVVSIELEPI